MISYHLESGWREHTRSPAAIVRSEAVTYADLARRVDSLVAAWGRWSGRRVGVCLPPSSEAIVALIALDRLGAHVWLGAPARAEESAQHAAECGWDAFVTVSDGVVALQSALPCGGSNASGPPCESTVTLFTSGTAGRPKAVRHSWVSLARSARRDARYAGTRWLGSYPLHLFAGLQVFLQAFLNWATLVIPESADPQCVAATMRDHRVSFASGTPTFWRRLLLLAPRDVLSACPLTQITLGGEAASQDVLDGLRQTYPAARIVHIYASTELGRCFSVTDGNAGFPAEFVGQKLDGGNEIDVRDGELYVRSGNAMLRDGGRSPAMAGAEGWFRTGDLVESVGDRFVFVGRADDVINVGGTKVLPTRIESIVRRVPGVAEARVYGRKSSVVGEIVAADIVLLPGANEAAVRATLRQYATAHLRPPEYPRAVQVVTSIATNAAGKVVRGKVRA